MYHYLKINLYKYDSLVGVVLMKLCITLLRVVSF